LLNVAKLVPLIGIPITFGMDFFQRKWLAKLQLSLSLKRDKLRATSQEKESMQTSGKLPINSSVKGRCREMMRKPDIWKKTLGFLF